MRVSLWSGLPISPASRFKVFSQLAKEKINVDIILQSIGRDGSKDISFTIGKNALADAKRVLEENQERIGFHSLEISDTLAKVSIVGAGMQNNPGVASLMFEALYGINVNIHMISTSEIKVSVLIDACDTDRAVQAIHDKFFGK